MSQNRSGRGVGLISEQILWRGLFARAAAGSSPPFEVLVEGDGGPATRGECLRCRPRVIVLDVPLLRTDPIELARFLMRRLPESRLLVVSGETDPVSLNRFDEIGVPGFVDKEQPLEILEEALLEVAAGRRYRTAVLTRNQGRLKVDPAAFSKILTAREQDVLRHVVRGWTSRAIAERLNLSPRSVETFRYRLMRKLDVRNVAGLMAFAFRHGLVPAGGGTPGNGERRQSPISTAGT